MTPQELNRTVWATIKVSKIHGIGVFAIRDVPKDTYITDHSVHNLKQARLIRMNELQFKLIFPEIRELILDRSSFAEGQDMLFYSPNVVSCIQSFMNHSKTPNTNGIRALVDIKKGEELTEDYNTLTFGLKLHPLIVQHRKKKGILEP